MKSSRSRAGAEALAGMPSVRGWPSPRTFLHSLSQPSSRRPSPPPRQSSAACSLGEATGPGSTPRPWHSMHSPNSPKPRKEWRWAICATRKFLPSQRAQLPWRTSHRRCAWPGTGTSLGISGLRARVEAALLRLAYGLAFVGVPTVRQRTLVDVVGVDLRPTQPAKIRDARNVAHEAGGLRVINTKLALMTGHRHEVPIRHH